MVGRIGENLAHDSRCQIAGSLVMFLYDLDGTANFDVRSLFAVNFFWGHDFVFSNLRMIGLAGSSCGEDVDVVA